jgi:NH3-dependent NAD+ synthetase
LLVLELPIHQSKPELQRSSKHVKWLKQQYGDINVRSHCVDLTNAFEAIKATLTKVETNNQEALALANTRSRLRMVRNHTYLYFSISTLRQLSTTLLNYTTTSWLVLETK